ncbi:TonB-dependent receptor [Paraflavitalea sp. CAU 1676]|uniref:SusC/RagA family TonB-linked outer membrane protein n=1 Tax=Paraflavitalea sp. CAU 1676 TaxID=3032598 RepID=UPI0023DAD1A9|nr:TonB-dependent receptor [Paraflavitalea sp. CAU 1676]MDF2187955.1 TonB-dependent receptor [Paraflavitalea sp. CAU 1676]
MNPRLVFLTMLSIVLHSISSIAQPTPRTIRGTVLSEDQLPLEGASITIKGSGQGTASRKDGSFELPVTPQAKTLLVSFAGFEFQEIPLSQKDVYRVVLKKSSTQLEDIVVTGYSTQRKRFIAGAITTVGGDEIKNSPAAGFNQLLQGKASGVQVLSNSGVAGGSITFRIRGNNSINASSDPLYIIDGVFVSNAETIQTGLGQQQPTNPLATINPSDIESITILKDANATAIYGSQGANGVVIVTTRRGKQNTRAKISLNTYQGWSKPVGELTVANGVETAKLANEAVVNTAKDNGIDPSTVVLPFPNPDTLKTYDRLGDVYRTGRTSSYELSAQGGADRNTYYASIGYLKQESVTRPTDFERFTARLNYDNQLAKKLKLGTSIGITRTFRNVSSSDNNPQGVINSAYFVRSYLPVYNANGTYARYGSFDNHQALIDHLDNKAVGWRIIGNAFLEYSFLPELKLRSSWSIDKADEQENNYASTLISAGVSSNGSGAAFETHNLVLLNEQVLTWIKSFGTDRQHAINALVGNTISNTISELTSASGTGFPSNNITAISGASIRSGSSSRSVAKLASFFGKASYTYNDKYTIDASLRADGSSRFGANNQWGYFPSGGVTWRAGQESFIESLHFFDDLKLRASFGLTGNQNGVGAYAAKGLWGAGANYLEIAGTAPSQLANPDLTWETTRQFDAGVDVTILNKRLSVSLDYYHKYTYDLLLNVPVPNRLGFASVLQNYGTVSNKGFEVSVHSNNLSSRDFVWTTDFNISFNTNKIEKLAADISLGASGRNISILRQGYAVNSFQLYKQLYVDRNSGNAVYDDVNKDGSITNADRQIVGNALPKYSGGLTNNLQYKNFDLNVFIYFQQGNKIMDMNEFFMVHGGLQANIGFAPRQLERWQKPGDVTDIPRLTTAKANPNDNGGAANNYGGFVANLSSRYLKDGSFARLKTLSLGYTLPGSWLSAVKFSSARLYVQATNLFTVTNYTGADPEVSSQSGNQNTAGYDWATVPQPKTVQVGLTVSF